jgi:ATP-dependent DNA ligase
VCGVDAAGEGHRGRQASIQALWPTQPRSQSVGDREAARTAILYAFDLIEHDGEDLRHLPFPDRKAALARLLRDAKAGILLNEHISKDGPIVFAYACHLGAEGIVSKTTAPISPARARSG